MKTAVIDAIRNALTLPDRIELKRVEYRDNVTLGRLKCYLNGKLKVDVITDELPDKDNQVGISCIPEGVYTCVYNWMSNLAKLDPKFAPSLWVQDVPNRSEICVHCNTYVQTLEGCIAPGMTHKDINKDGIPDTSDTLTAMTKILDCFKKMQPEKKLQEKEIAFIVYS